MLIGRPDGLYLRTTIEHVGPFLVKSLGAENIAFWRRGIHCDLHPRWKADGAAACIDSIHEGTRQMYPVDTSSIIRSQSKEP